jgi:hypothetical protein
MQKITIFILTAAVVVLGLPTMSLAATEKPVATKSAVVVTKSTAKKVVAKTTTKPVVKKVEVDEVETIATSTIPAKPLPAGSIVAVSTSAVTSLTQKCNKAIQEANKFCKKIAAGCPSWSETPKCVKANEECDVKLQAAMDLCPSIEQ